MLSTSQPMNVLDTSNDHSFSLVISIHMLVLIAYNSLVCLNSQVLTISYPPLNLRFKCRLVLYWHRSSVSLHLKAQNNITHCFILGEI